VRRTGNEMGLSREKGKTVPGVTRADAPMLAVLGGKERREGFGNEGQIEARKRGPAGHLTRFKNKRRIGEAETRTPKGKKTVTKCRSLNNKR